MSHRRRLAWRSVSAGVDPMSAITNLAQNRPTAAALPYEPEDGPNRGNAQDDQDIRPCGRSYHRADGRRLRPAARRRWQRDRQHEQPGLGEERRAEGDRRDDWHEHPFARSWCSDRTGNRHSSPWRRHGRRHLGSRAIARSSEPAGRGRRTTNRNSAPPRGSTEHL